MYLHEVLENVPGRSVISNYGTPKKKVLEFLDSQLKPAMKSSWSYIKGSGDFNKKIKNISTIRILALFLRIPSWLRQMLWDYMVIS